MTAPAAVDILSVLREKFPQITPRASADHPAVNVPAADVVAVLAHLRDACSYDILSDLTAIDWAAGTSPRFTIVWHLLSTQEHAFLRVAADCVSDSEPEMASMANLWPGANWHEREVFDMFGIVFTGHPDLRRILMWEGYPYHPLRKEFPLAGHDGELHDSEIAAETGTKLIPAPMVGGPFVASSCGELNVGEAEPRAKDESWSERNPKPAE